MLNIRTILHPTDFSEASEAAFHLACSLARDHGSRLVLLHVVMPPTVAYTEGVMLTTSDEIQEQLWEKLDEITPDTSLTVERHMMEGVPAEEIMRLAEETQTDLIVMGCHGRRGITRLLMGSVAEEVVRKAGCPVLTVKVPLTHMVEESTTAVAAGTA